MAESKTPEATPAPSAGVPDDHVVVPKSVLEQLQANQPAAKSNAVKTADAFVTADGYQYILRDPADSSKVLATRLARRGEKIAVSQDELDRGRKLGALGTEEDLHLIELNVAAGGSLPDEGALSRMSAPEVLAYLSNHTDDLDRIEQLETRRGDSARPQVLRAIEVTREINGLSADS